MADDSKQAKQLIAADFIEVLISMRSGRVAMECSEKLAAVVQAVRKTGKKGRLSLVIDINPSRISNDDGQVKEVEVTHKVVTVEPENSAGTTIFYATKEGALTREDPDQMAMEFEEESKRAK